MTDIIPMERIEQHILLIRGQKVMLDSDLAELYGVATKVLVQAIKRNLERFPEDFMLQLNYQEVAVLRSQFVTSRIHGGRRYLPYAFHVAATNKAPNHALNVRHGYLHFISSATI